MMGKSCKNRYCIDGIEFITCCSGYQCGCMAQPVAAKFCTECNADKREPTDEEAIRLLSCVEWIDD